jgi:hypothetical protein
MYKRDYQIIISYTNNDELMWDTNRKGEPHYVGNNIEELQLVKESCEKVIEHVNRILNKKDKYQ